MKGELEHVDQIAIVSVQCGTRTFRIRYLFVMYNEVYVETVSTNTVGRISRYGVIDYLTHLH